MQKVSKIWMDGKLIPWDKANTHILTHTLHYGGGAFEGIRFYSTKKGSAIFRLKDHIDRLFYSSGVLKMKSPFTKKQIEEAIIKLIKTNKIKEGYIRPIIYFGYGKMGLNPKGAPVNAAIAIWPWGAYLGDKPVKATISKFIRIHPKSTYSAAKLCGHYVNSILASIDAHERGYGESILLDYKGNVAEGPGENIFIVKNNTLITPKKGNILAGITRDAIIKLAKNNKIPVKVEIISKKKLYNADEAFFTGTAAEISAIASIDGKKIGNGKLGPITKQIKKEFIKVVTGESPKYGKWITYVN